MAQGTLKIHTDNILPIIKKWLYSEKDIFVRELVSNSCDAMKKLKILRDEGEAQFLDDELRIDITIDKENKTIQFRDTGLGMTSEEVEKYIAQVAFSGAEEFVAKYKSKEEKDQIIGHFGLGFYSSYMISKKVEIETLSYRPNSRGVFWSCDGSSEYSIEEKELSSRGTTITLFVDDENGEFLEEAALKKILQHYCSFLPYPIYLNNKQINASEPLWLKAPSDCTEKEYLDFFHQLYPLEPDPIFWIHLNVDYPFNLKGILYFPKLHRRFDWNQSNIKLFCNRVFVSDNCKDLIPDFLMVLRGAIESPDIPLNVSRSYLQMDRTVRQLATHISKKIADKLSSLFTNEKEKFLQYWPDIELIVKLGAIQDEKFYDKVKHLLVWKNLTGEWTSIQDYIDAHQEQYKKTIFYTSDDKHHSHFLDLYKNKGIEVLILNGHIDTSMMNFLESKHAPVKFQRIDGAIDPSILDPSKEKTLLDADGKTESVKIAEYVQSALAKPDLEVEAKSLATENLPGFIMINEHERRMKEFMALSEHSLPPSFGDKRTFVVNTNSNIINKIYKIKDKEPKLAQEMLSHLYELSLLSQKELEPKSLPDFVTRSNQVLESLLMKLAN